MKRAAPNPADSGDKSRVVIGNTDRAFSDVLSIFVDPELRGLLTFVVLLLLIGTSFYMVVENWDFVEALYFSVATLTTVGYGDLHPTNDFSRLFTSLYIMVGVGFILSAVMTVARLASHPVVRRFRGSGSKDDTKSKVK